MSVVVNNSKLKLTLLYLKRILEEETDAEHGFSMTKLIKLLHDYEIPAKRKGVYRNLETLKKFSVDVQTFQRNPVEYTIVRRDFTLSELMLLVDTVESCKSLTHRQSTALITNLELLASDHERALPNRRIHVSGRISSKNESVFSYIDIMRPFSSPRYVVNTAKGTFRNRRMRSSIAIHRQWSVDVLEQYGIEPQIHQVSFALLNK